MHAMKKLFLLLLMMSAFKLMMADDLTATITNSTDSMNNGAIDLSLNGGVAPYTFQWMGPNGYNSTDEDISGLEPGEYCVTVSDFYCGTATLCVMVEEDVASGMAIENTSSLTVFPNPFSKEFSVVFDSPVTGEYIFGLHDVSGKAVWTETRPLTVGANTCHFILNGGIVAGRYEMTIQDKRGSILSRSVVRLR